MSTKVRVLAFIALLAILALQVVSASAVTGYRVQGTGSFGLTVRNGPGTDYSSLGVLAEGTWIDIECQTYGPYVNGSRIWNKLWGPIRGFVSDYYINTPVFNGFSPGIPTCNQHSLFQHDNSQLRNTFIYDPGPGSGITHAHFASSSFVSYYGSRGFDRNFMLLAPIQTFDASAASWRNCTDRFQQHRHAFCGSSQGSVRIGDVIPHGIITAKRWGNAFIGTYCGNNTPSGTNGPVPVVRGTKYLDRNANGKRDPGEPGLSGWVIDLYFNGKILATKTTNASGAYEFSLDANAMPSISGGTYEVRERLVAGYRQTAAPAAFTVPLGTANAVLGGMDFGNYKLPNISVDDPEPVVEGTGENTESVFHVSLDEPTGKSISVHFQTSDGTAQAPTTTTRSIRRSRSRRESRAWPCPSRSWAMTRSRMTSTSSGRSADRRTGSS